MELCVRSSCCETFLQGDPPKKKTEPIYFWLKLLNLILAFFFQDMKKILCMKKWDHR